jgi:hypothetical protein
MTEYDPFDDALGNDYATIADYSEVGMSHHGVLDDMYKQQARKFDRKNPGKGPLLYWGEDRSPTEIPNDEPLMEKHAVFVTDERENDADDGRREIWLNKKALTDALRAAVLKAGAKQLARGGWWRVTRVHDHAPKYKGGNPPRGWHVLYKTPEQYAAEGPSPIPPEIVALLEAGPAPAAAKSAKPKSSDDPWAVSDA